MNRIKALSTSSESSINLSPSTSFPPCSTESSCSPTAVCVEQQSSCYSCYLKAVANMIENLDYHLRNIETKQVLYIDKQFYMNNTYIQVDMGSWMKNFLVNHLHSDNIQVSIDYMIKYYSWFSAPYI